MLLTTAAKNMVRGGIITVAGVIWMKILGACYTKLQNWKSGGWIRILNPLKDIQQDTITFCLPCLSPRFLLVFEMIDAHHSKPLISILFIIETKYTYLKESWLR